MAVPQVQRQDVQLILDAQHVQPVTVANLVMNIGAMQGGVINVAPRGQRAGDRIHPRQRPPRILPRSVPRFLNRDDEQRVVGQALARRQVVDVHGLDGVGKTALISQTMQTQLPTAFPDGVVYLSAEHETCEDLLQDLFDCFFETDGDVKVTENDLRRHMAGKRALIAVDDANHLKEREAESLAQAVPQCSVLIAGRKHQVWQGAAVTLRGLPAAQAAALFEQHWGRVSAQDRPTVEAICDQVDNVPLAIVKAAKTAIQRQMSLTQLLQQVRSQREQDNPIGQAFSLIAGSLSPEERRVLGGLAAPGGPTVSLEALAAITGMSPGEINRHLASLQQMALVYANSPRYSLDEGLRPYIRGAWASRGMRARAAQYYMRLAPRLQGQSKDPDERNVMTALGYYYRQGQWEQVVYIARAAERYLATTGRWGQWRRRLNQAWRAARELGDRATEAWAQNQLGLIAMGLGNVAAAAAFFKSALGIWQALGDRAGMTIAQWNMQVLAGAPPPPKARSGAKTATGGGGSSLPILLAAAATVLLLIGIVIALGGNGEERGVWTVPPLLTTAVPTSSTTPSVTTSITPSPTSSTTPSVTPSITPSPTSSTTPSVTPSITPSPTPTPFVEFYADPAMVLLCGCTRIYWNAENVAEVYFQGRGVTAPNSEEVCLDSPGTVSYKLEVVYWDGSLRTFTTDVVGSNEPTTSLRESVWDMLGTACLAYDDYYSCPDEVHVWYPEYAPYRCVGEQAIPQIIKSAVNYTEPVTSLYGASDLANVLSVMIPADGVPEYLILVYPHSTIDGLDYLLDEWPYYRFLYSWDQPSDAVVLLRYRKPDTNPVAKILSPEDGASLSSATVTFSGLAEDAEDANSDLTVEWFSDVQGFLGNGWRDGTSGRSITVTLDLPSCGTNYHTITLRVTDSANNVSEDSIVVSIYLVC